VLVAPSAADVDHRCAACGDLAELFAMGRYLPCLRLRAIGRSSLRRPAGFPFLQIGARPRPTPCFDGAQTWDSGGPNSSCPASTEGSRPFRSSLAGLA